MKKPILIVGIILVVSVFGYFIYNKFNLKSVDTNYDEWVEYLNKQDLIIKSSVWNSDAEQCEFEIMFLSNDDIKNVVNNLSTQKITKYYYGSVPTTGTICSDRFLIEYGDNKLNLESDGSAWINDENLISKLDLVVDETIYADDANNDNFVYIFENGFVSVFNEYK